MSLDATLSCKLDEFPGEFLHHKKIILEMMTLQRVRERERDTMIGLLAFFQDWSPFERYRSILAKTV